MNINLIGIADEIILKIVKDDLLNVEDVINVSIVCHRLNHICDSEDLWKSKLIQRWPWIWKKISTQESVIGSWKREVFSIMKLSKKLREILDTLSHQLYKYQNITSPVLATITKLLDIGTFAEIYCLNELREIRSQSSYKNLTLQYYADLVLQHIHQIVCQEEWSTYMALPPDKQILEEGAFLFAKWFQAAKFLDTEIKDIVAKLDDMSVEVLAHLSKTHPHHPALSQELRKRTEPLEDSLWREKECRQIFDAVNHIFYSVHKYRSSDQYYMVENSLLNRVMETRKGIPVSMSILYQSVCHRLGVLLLPVNCPSHFMLKWLVPGGVGLEYIDAFNSGKRTESSLLQPHPVSSNASKSACSTLKVLERLANNTIHASRQGNHGNKDTFMEICATAEILTMLKPEDDRALAFLYGRYCEFDIHADRVVSGCERLLASKEDDTDERASQYKKKLFHMKENAKAMLKAQEKAPAPCVPKGRTCPESKKVLYATGMVMTHKLYHYTCVIFGWDTTCRMPLNWILLMNVHQLQFKDEQPFYNVLVSDGSQRYAAQENLLHTAPVAVPNESIGKYFAEYNRHYYVPNKELDEEYPDENPVRKKGLYPDFNV